MPRKTKEEKLLSIEEQIKRLQSQKKELENKKKFNIGKALLEEWDIDSEETALMLIKELKEDVLKLLANEELLVSTGGNSNE